MLAADMQDLLLEAGADPAEPGLADGSTNNSSSKNGSKENNKVGQGVAKPGPKCSSTASGAVTEKKGEVVEEEEEDELTLCIVCMTEKRNACLVHGRTSHQVRAEGGDSSRSREAYTYSDLRLRSGVCFLERPL